MMKSMLLPLVLIAAPAAAQSSLTATLETPTTRHGKIVAGESIWNCTDATCSGRSNNGGRFGDINACKDISRQLGSVTAFTSQRGALSAEDLTKCNQRAKKIG